MNNISCIWSKRLHSVTAWSPSIPVNYTWAEKWTICWTTNSRFGVILLYGHIYTVLVWKWYHFPPIPSKESFLIKSANSTIIWNNTINCKHKTGTLLDALSDVASDWGWTMLVVTAVDASSCSVNAWICSSKLFSAADDIRSWLSCGRTSDWDCCRSCCCNNWSVVCSGDVGVGTGGVDVGACTGGASVGAGTGGASAGAGTGGAGVGVAAGDGACATAKAGASNDAGAGEVCKQHRYHQYHHHHHRWPLHASEVEDEVE